MTATRSRDVPHHRQVVRDEQVGQAELALQVVEQVDDLGLDRHVERGDRLVGDDQLGPQGERPGDADALALAAGELVRVAVVVLRVEPDQLQQLLDRPLDAVLGVGTFWMPERRPDDRADGVPRVQRRVRVLEDHLDVPAQRAHLARCDRWVMSRPSKMILPAVGSSSRVTSRPVVDLPQPDSPTRPSVSPVWTLKSMPSTAWTAPTLRLQQRPW